MRPDPDLQSSLLWHATSQVLQLSAGIPVTSRSRGSSDLFVPCFTTKPDGSGIGLILSRPIAESHVGSPTLQDRRPGPGCEVRRRLPLR